MVCFTRQHGRGLCLPFLPIRVAQRVARCIVAVAVTVARFGLPGAIVVVASDNREVHRSHEAVRLRCLIPTSLSNDMVDLTPVRVPKV